MDFSEDQVKLYQQLVKKAVEFFSLYGYQELILPLLEEKDLFRKSVGQDTDIAQNQMMQIKDKDIVLRPEATAQIVRYYLQHRLDKKNGFYKFFYVGPMFRGEKPQRGRLRQFNHIGVEAVGSDSFCLDAEVIKLAVDIVEAAGLKRKDLQVNSLGCRKDKRALSDKIKKGLKKKENNLCADCRRRLEKNPLRVVDCKKDNCRKEVSFLGLGKTHLCPDCVNHFDSLLKALDALGVCYRHNPYLVRGLDYYTNTVFEITSQELGSQDALGAGGRYNDLFNQLGGINLPAVGFALGAERILLALERKSKPEKAPLVFVARGDNFLEEEALRLLSGLRKKNIACTCDFRKKSLKSQLRYTQKIGADYVIILGRDKLNKGKIILRNMKNSKQEEIKLKELPEKVKKLAGCKFL